MMKKFFLLLSALCVATFASAESHDALLSKIEKAKAATQDAKKNTKPATWEALGAAYYDAYQSVKGEVFTGAKPEEVKLFMGEQKVLSSETVEYSGRQYTVDHYQDKDLYFSERGFEFVIVTKPVVKEDMLALASSNYLKAHELDSKGSKTHAIVQAMEKLHEGYINDAWAYYFINDYKTAANMFKGAMAVYDNPVVNKKDTTSTYFAAVLYHELKDNENAKKYYNACFAMGYDQDGNGHSSMAEILKNEGDVEGAKALLNEGFQQFPSSQAILISLINLYMDTKDDPNKILDLIHTAQNNEPKNASLVYAEGNVYKQLGDIEKAVEYYAKSVEVDPTYVYGTYEVGNTYLNKAIEIQSAMDALDVNDVNGYNKLRDEFDVMLKKCIPAFEKAFEMATQEDIKKAAAQNLKQVYFIFRNDSAEYQAGYDKYNAFLGE